MTRPSEESLTGREAQVMDVIRRLGEATAEQVRPGLSEPLHDSTIRTLLRVLAAKGYLAHEPRGKAYVHRPHLDRRKARRLAVGSVLSRFFGGSTEDSSLHLLDEEAITPDLVEALRKRRIKEHTQGDL